jgi:hypothetical protein
MCNIIQCDPISTCRLRLLTSMQGGCDMMNDTPTRARVEIVGGRA